MNLIVLHIYSVETATFVKAFQVYVLNNISSILFERSKLCCFKIGVL